MQMFNRIIFWIAIVSILFFILPPIIGLLLPLEFTNDRFKDIYEKIRFTTLPIAILLTLFGTIKITDSSQRKTTKIVLTIVAAVLSGMILFFSFWSGMCAWATERILFDNSENPSKKIVLREFGCGATDSGSPVIRVCKIKTITPYLIWVTKADTTSIDRQVWTRAKENSD